LTFAKGRLAASDQRYGLIAFEQIEADTRCLAPWTRKSSIALEEQLGIALCNRSQGRDVLCRSYSEGLFARLARAKDFARTPQAQILLCDTEAVAGLAHQGKASATDLGETEMADQQASALAAPAPDTAAQLMELRQAESLRALDDHQGRVWNIDTHFNDGGCDQDPQLA
jgi:hypothetical protein